MRMHGGLVVLVGLVFLCTDCRKDHSSGEGIRSFSLDSMEGILTRSGVSFDRDVSSDGKGSVKIDAAGSRAVSLFEVRDLQIDNSRLIYQARLKTNNVQEQVILEMRCFFPGLGEYFSRSVHHPLTGTTDWTMVQTPFLLQKGQKPEVIKLNVVINGAGTVWIDDIVLMKAPL